MKKTTLAFLLPLVVTIALTGCSAVSNLIFGNRSVSGGGLPSAAEDGFEAYSEGESDTASDSGFISADDGYADGRIGTTFKTAFFNYSVDNVAYSDSYEAYTAAEGFQLVSATITMKNTFGKVLPMYNNDFQIQWSDLGNGEEDYAFGVILDNSTTSMPKEWELKRGETATYTLVFEVPAAAAEFSVSYLEYYEDGTEGDVFFTYFEKPEGQQNT